MNRKNITKEIMELHQKQIIDEISREVEEELKDGIPDELLTQADKLIKMVQDRKDKDKKVMPVNFGKDKAPEFQAANDMNFEIELLAAAGKESKLKWYEGVLHLLNWGMLELSPRDNDLNDVRVVITPSSDGKDQFKDIFERYSGQDVKLMLDFGDDVYIEAELYVYPELTSVEGDGVIKEVERPDSNKLNFRLKPIGDNE